MYAIPEQIGEEHQPVRQLLLVTPELLPQVWPQVEPMFLDNINLWGEYYTIESFPALFQKGRLQLWAMNDEENFLMVMVTQMLEYPRIDVLHVVFMAGEELKDGLDLFYDVIDNWAAKQGASKITLMGRDGFMRALKPYGYKKESVFMVKDISLMKEH